MAEPKTKPNKTGVAAYLKAITDPQRRREARALIAIMRSITGARPVMWGRS